MKPYKKTGLRHFFSEVFCLTRYLNALNSILNGIHHFHMNLIQLFMIAELSCVSSRNNQKVGIR